jgi:LmbE family N-acetylglucosaminyl deacetylase
MLAVVCIAAMAVSGRGRMPRATATIGPDRSSPTPLNVSGWAAYGQRVLVVTAHPDDAEGFAGGLLSSLHATGTINISYLVVTTGNAGGKCYDDWGPRPGPAGFRDCEKEELAFTRRREMIEAAAFFGVPRSQVFRLGLDDGMVLAHHETSIRRSITAVVRTVKPHIILTHYPYPNLAAPPT